MDIRQMRYFLAVAEEGQITKAAARLHITQPPLSQQLKLLEEELGLRLFERHGKHIQLTEAGNVLRARAEEIVMLANATVKELSELNKGEQGTLSMASVASLGAIFLGRYISTFHKQYPNVTFQMWEGDTFRVTELVNKGIAEIGVIRTPFDSKVYDSVICSTSDHMIAAYTSEWDQSLGGEMLHLNMLEGKPLIILRRNEQKIIETCRGQGFEPNVICVSNEIHTMLLWARFGLGIALVPSPARFLFEASGLQFTKLDESSFETGSAIIWLKNHPLSVVAKNFIKAAREVLDVSD